MAADQAIAASAIDLGPFRRRIRLLRVWRLGSIGGTVGAGAAIIALAGNRLGYWDSSALPAIWLTCAGFAAGFAIAVFERITDVQIARSVDRRSALDERLTTLYELSPRDDTESAYLAAVREDASGRVASLSARRLYPLRVQRNQILCAAVIAVAAAVSVVTNTTLLQPLKSRLEAREMRRQGARVEQIARPLLAHANRPDASPQEKQLAARLDRFASDLRKDRLTRQQALVRANQLAQQAREVEEQRNLAVSQALSTARSAGEKLQAMAAQGALQRTQTAKLAAQASSLQQQMANLKQQLSAADAGKSGLTALQKAAMEKRLSQLEKEYRRIRLSQQALDTFAKLSSLPQYRMAMALLSRLQAQQQALQSGQSPPMSAAQAKAMAAQLEQLAKELDSNAKMQAYANALLKAAMEAQENMREMRLSEGLLSAFGLQTQEPGLGPGGRGGTNPGVWQGGIGHLHHFDKSSLLHVKFQTRAITSQIGKTGPETYTDEVGPAQMTAKSGIPYEDVLPKYEKTAETALSNGEIPPSMRAQVREYFESLHQSD